MNKPERLDDDIFDSFRASMSIVVKKMQADVESTKQHLKSADKEMAEAVQKLKDMGL